MTTVITRPCASSLIGRIENLIPDHCRSVHCLHGDTETSPVRYEAHRSEIKYVRRAIAIARREAEAAALARKNDA